MKIGPGKQIPKLDIQPDYGRQNGGKNPPMSSSKIQ